MEPAGLRHVHWVRLRRLHGSAGWPCLDGVELDLIAAGLLRTVDGAGALRGVALTDAGLQALAMRRAGAVRARDAHEALVARIAARQHDDGRIVWCNLALRAKVADDERPQGRWCVARPDVFSVRRTTRPGWLEPVVHEIKVSRADLLGDLRRPGKRAAYRAMAARVYYVLGLDARGRPVGGIDDVPADCGVLLAHADRLDCLRIAPARAMNGFGFDTWMSLAQATPWRPGPDEPPRQMGF